VSPLTIICSTLHRTRTADKGVCLCKTQCSAHSCCCTQITLAPRQ
jgi:hypothetical protein